MWLSSCQKAPEARDYKSDQLAAELSLALHDFILLRTGDTRYKGIQGDTRGYKGRQGDTRRYKGIQGETRGYKEIQGDTRRYKEMQEDARGYKRI